MKRALKAVAALLSLLVSASFAHAQLTPVVTNHGVYMGGTLVSAGTVTFTPVNTQGTAIAFAQGGGGLNGPMAFPCTITAGLISGTCQIPDSALTTPANILYYVLITNTTTQKSFGYIVAGITGSSWALDSYGPPAQTTNVQAVQASYGIAAPPSSCVSPSEYTQNISGGKFFVCVGGIFVQVTAGVLAPSGAIADYNFLQGSGVTVTDNSGSGNNATLGSGAAAPVWSSNGLSFSGNQTISLPTALNGGQTWAMGLCFNPLTKSASSLPTNQYPIVISSTMTGGQGLAITYGYNVGTLTTNLPFAYGPGIIARGTHATQSQVAINGCHAYVVTLGTSGTSLDHIYLDGAEVGNYGLQGATVGAQSSGNLMIGASATSDLFNNSAFNGSMYRFLVYSTPLSSVQVQQLSAVIVADMNSRGVFLKPPSVLLGTPQLYAIGDSITWGTGTTTPWENLLSLTNQPAYTINNYGIGGIALFAIAGSESGRVAPQCSSGVGPNVAIVFAGTNDFSATQTSTVTGDALATLSSMASEVQTLKAAGCRVLVATMLSRGATAPGNGSLWDASKDAFDALLVQQYKQIGANGLIDFAAEPLLGADGAYAGTYFNTDHIHPNQTGHNRLAVIASNSLNYFAGSNLANPDIVTATTYQMLSSDGAVTAAPTANAAYTMPDCTGPSGESYTISNPQSAFTVTVKGGTNQPINGLTTAITIPSNSTVTLRDVPNPKSSSGCHWVM